MIQHPVLLFIFAMANIVTALGFFVITFGIMTKYKTNSRTVQIAGTLYCGLSAVAHIGLAVNVLFRSSMTAGQASASPPLLALHSTLAVAIWVFLVGALLQFGSWSDVPTSSAEIHLDADDYTDAELDAMIQGIEDEAEPPTT